MYRDEPIVYFMVWVNELLARLSVIVTAEPKVTEELLRTGAVALGMVSRVAVPLQDVDVKDVPDIPPVADILILFEPSELWATFTVSVVMVTQVLLAARETDLL